MRRWFRRGALTLIWLLAVALPALAQSNPYQSGVGGGVNPGERIGSWIQHNVAALFAPLLGVVAVYYLVRRQFTQFLSFAAFAVLVALFVFAGNEFKDAALALARWIIGR